MWLPVDSPLVVQVATPPVSGWAPQPKIVAVPSLKTTVPVGTSPVTVAVNVTDWPGADGFCEGPTAVLLVVTASSYVASIAAHSALALTVADAEYEPVADTTQYMPNNDGA